MPLLTDSDRQDALRRILAGGYFINAWEARALGLAFGVPGSVILEGVRALLALAVNPSKP
jgi:hypothetical protein